MMVDEARIENGSGARERIDRALMGDYAPIPEPGMTPDREEQEWGTSQQALAGKAAMDALIARQGSKR